MKLETVGDLIYIRSDTGRLFATYNPARATMQIVRNGERLEIPLDELLKNREIGIDVITEASVYCGNK